MREPNKALELTANPLDTTHDGLGLCACHGHVRIIQRFEEGGRDRIRGARNLGRSQDRACLSMLL